MKIVVEHDIKTREAMLYQLSVMEDNTDKTNEQECRFLENFRRQVYATKPEKKRKTTRTKPKLESLSDNLIVENREYWIELNGKQFIGKVVSKVLVPQLNKNGSRTMLYKYSVSANGGLYGCKRHNFIRQKRAKWIAKCISMVKVNDTTEYEFRHKPTLQEVNRMLRNDGFPCVDDYQVEITLN